MRYTKYNTSFHQQSELCNHKYIPTYDKLLILNYIQKYKQ